MQMATHRFDAHHGVAMYSTKFNIEIAIVLPATLAYMVLLCSNLNFLPA